MVGYLADGLVHDQLRGLGGQPGHGEYALWIPAEVFLTAAETTWPLRAHTNLGAIEAFRLAATQAADSVDRALRAFFDSVRTLLAQWRARHQVVRGLA